MVRKKDYEYQLPNIAFMAETRSGKDLACSTIQEHYKAVRVAYGDVLKEKFYDLFPNIPKEPKPIKELVHFGQSMRVIDPDIWVNYTIGRMKLQMSWYNQAPVQNPSYIFTDVRQQNEYDACKKIGCVMIKIVVPLEIRKQRLIALGEKFDENTFKASTETELQKFKADYVITNDGTIEEFQAKVLALMEELRKPYEA